MVKDDGELVLAVNDIWLSGKMKNVYVLPFDENFDYYKNEAHFQAIVRGEDYSSWSDATEIKRAKENYQGKLRNWNVIVKKKAWNIWYQDNTGSFSVSITVN